jgi:AGZA family xanthine/uracil permease-like MFS transporter
VIGAQAFQTSVARHAPAIVLALVPNIAQWAQTQIDNSLAAAGTNAGSIMDALNGNGVVYQGMAILGSGAVLAGLMLGAIAVFVIDKAYSRAIFYCVAAAVLAAVGLIHDPAGLIFQFTDGFSVRAPNEVWIGYLLAAVVIWVVAAREGGVGASDLVRAVTTPPTEEERAA